MVKPRSHTPRHRAAVRPPPTFRATLLRLLFLPSLLLLLGMVAAGWIVVQQTGVLGERLNARVAVAIGAQVDARMGNRSRVLDQMAEVLEGLSAADQSLRFATLADRQKIFFQVDLLGPDRVVRASWPAGAPSLVGSGASFLDDLPFPAGLIWSGSVRLSALGPPTVAVARRYGQGVLVGYLELGPLSRELTEVARGTETSVTLVDGRGTYLSHPDPQRVNDQGRDEAYLARRISKGTGAQTYIEHRDDALVLVSSQPLGEGGWTLLVAQPLAALYQPLVPVLFLLLPLVVLFTLGAILMVYLMDRHLLGALAILRSQTEGLGRGDFQGRAVRTRYQDLNVILDSFDAMRQSVWVREQDLRVSERRFRRMFEDAAVGIFHTSYSGELLDLNQAMATMLGYSDPAEVKQALGGVTKGLYVAPEERGAVLRMLQESSDSKVKVTTEFFHRTGRVLTVNHHLARVFDTKRGEFILEAFAEDITDLKKAEEEVRVLNSDLELKVSERTQHLERALEDLSTAQEHLVQSEKMAALGQMIAGIAHELNTPLGAIHASNESIAILLKQVLVEQPILLASLPAELAGLQKAFYEASARDLDVVPSATLRRRRRDTLAALTERGVVADEETVDFLVELGVSGRIDEWLPLLRAPVGPAVVRLTYDMVCLEKSCAVIASASEKAAKVINALRTFSHQAQENTFERVEVHLGVETVLTLFQSRLKGGVAVKTRLTSRARVWGLEDKLNQVWTNLVANALHAMDGHGTLEVEVSAKAGLVRISVVDSGPGIPEAIQARIFEPFFTTKKVGEGTGMGLDICRRIVEEHHGRLAFESRPGRTEFYVEIPEAR